MSKAKQILQKAAHSVGYNISKIRHPIEYPYLDVLDLILKDYIRHNQDIFFIQIGANDGVTADPVSKLIKNYHWRGLLVEPVPAMFKKLVENYQDQPQLIFENLLIGNQDGTATLYGITNEEAGLPAWCYQMASLDRNIVMNVIAHMQNPNLPKDLDSLIEAIDLPSLTVKSLISKHDIKKIDLLIIDTMGFDFEIIKMIDFDLIKPSIIHFEHSLLSLEEQEACFKYLAKAGYSLSPVSVDTIAYLNAPTRLGRYSFSEGV